LDYQDCRRTLTDGFDFNEVDALEDGPVADDKIPPAPIERTPAAGFERIKLAVGEYWRCWRTANSYDSSMQDHTGITLRITEFLGDEPSAIVACCRRTAKEYVLRQGAAEQLRVGDRYLSEEARRLRNNLIIGIMESIRSGIQTAFYVCDYSTKPNMTCAPVLQHMAHGMAGLEAAMKEEKAKQDLEAQIRRGMHHGDGLRSEKAPLYTAGAKPLNANEQEARKRLIRLWSSANQAIMKGCCLMSIQLLTGREVIRTHRHWRLLMKRPVWSAQEALRQDETGLTEDVDITAHRLDQLDVVHPTPLAQDAVGSGDESEEGGALVARPDEDEKPRRGPPNPTKQAPKTVKLSNDAFYDDWLHRGFAEPLRAMNHYIYGMYVAVVPKVHAHRDAMRCFPFDHHYNKASHSVQVLLEGPRTPFLHGVTLPTKDADPETNALMHQTLFRPTRCPGSGFCNQPHKHSALYMCPAICLRMKGDPAPFVYGLSCPRIRASAAIRGARRFVQPWRAFEAEQQTLARRNCYDTVPRGADCKLEMAKRVPCLTDVTCQRKWFMPGALETSFLQDWLIPWLCGGGSHLYAGPCLAGGRGHCTPSRVADCRPSYSVRSFTRTHTVVATGLLGPHANTHLGFLRPLQLDVVHYILRFIGHLTTDAGNILLVANTDINLQAMRRRPNCRNAVCEEHDGCMYVSKYNIPNDAPFTSFGVHDEQLFPFELFAYLTVEVSANWNFMAEARKRPRPSLLHADAAVDEDKDVGLKTQQADVGDVDEPGKEHQADDTDRRHATPLDIRYKPHMRLRDDDVAVYQLFIFMTMIAWWAGAARKFLGGALAARLDDCYMIHMIDLVWTKSYQVCKILSGVKRSY
jgi:hypothetical protein